MATKSKKTNPQLTTLITELKKQSFEQETALWKDIALRLEKPLRNWPVVTLDHIERYVSEKETALIPGKVLSTGILTKKITIAAWAFSDKSIDKIKKAGGKPITLSELLKQNPKGKDIRIIG